MANTITGRILRIGPTINLTTKSNNTFAKRELVLDCTRIDQNGQRGYENTPAISFTQDKCSLLDQFQPGMLVTVYIDIEGRYYQPKDQYFNDIKGWKIEPASPTAPQPAQPVEIAQAPAPQQAPAPAPDPAHKGDDLPF